MEIVDLYNKQKKKIGKTMERGSKEQRLGEYARSVHIWFLNSKGELLIQKRSDNRKRNPGKWAFTGGAVDAGETTLETAIREIKEELGLTFSEEQLDFLITYKREWNYVDVWLVKADFDIEDLTLQKEEVQAAKWVSIKELNEIIEKGEFVASIKQYYHLFLSILEKCYEVKI